MCTATLYGPAERCADWIKRLRRALSEPNSYWSLQTQLESTNIWIRFSLSRSTTIAER